MSKLPTAPPQIPESASLGSSADVPPLHPAGFPGSASGATKCPTCGVDQQALGDGKKPDVLESAAGRGDTQSRADYWTDKLSAIGGMDNSLIYVPADGVREIINDLREVERQRDEAWRDLKELREDIREKMEKLDK